MLLMSIPSPSHRTNGEQAVNTETTAVEVVVAGHICLDIIPAFEERAVDEGSFLTPGTLVSVGPAILSTGGPVSNTGLALHRLGVSTRLMGKVGDDLFGQAIIGLLREQDPALASGMIVDADESTSYSVVISAPGVDRVFLHSAGANDTFRADDVDINEVKDARLFHFGYPPLMRRMYQDQGAELSELMKRVKEAELTTSLDMAYPDPESEAGRTDWATVLERTLPAVDIFLPSLEEILFMLDRPRLGELTHETGGELAACIQGTVLSDLGERLLEMGAALVVLKLGSQGLYMRTTDDPARLAAMGACVPTNAENWLGRELLAPCFKTEVVGTTGAGDATIGGFLTGLLKQMPIEEVMTGAVAVGAFNVEGADALSGLRDWATVQSRIETGWERLPVELELTGWHWREEPGIWVSPRDASREHNR